MLEPGAKHWVEKFFSLVHGGEISLDTEIPEGMEKEEFLHARLFQTGLAFGFPAQFLFVHELDSSSWTLDERVKVLLFESMLHVYLMEHDELNRAEFEQSLLDFYADYKEEYSFNVLRFFVKDTPQLNIERILGRRVHVKKTWTNLFWVNYLSNSLVFLDVLAYQQFLKKGNALKDDYDSYVKAVIYTIMLSSQADGVVERQEKTLFDVFMASANLSGEVQSELNLVLASGNISLNDLKLPESQDRLLHYYLLDLAVLTVFSDLTAMDEEMVFLYELCNYLAIDTQHLHHALILIEAFVLENNHKIPFLRESSSYDRLYRSFSRRWIKVLGRNKDRLVEELKNNKELLELVNKSLVKELSPVEKEKVKSQFKDLVKSMPALAIFMLPGGALLLPIITRIIPDLLPSSFQHNKIDKEDLDPPKKE